MPQEADAGKEGGEAKRVSRVRGLVLPDLKQWRILRGLTQQQLADRVGVRLQYISRVEQGKRGCSQLVAQKIAGALEVDLRDLGADPDEGTSETLSAPHYLH